MTRRASSPPALAFVEQAPRRSPSPPARRAGSAGPVGSAVAVLGVAGAAPVVPVVAVVVVRGWAVQAVPAAGRPERAGALAVRLAAVRPAVRR
ncbi:hypothetical protein Acsp04_04680 [Actinomadura sp. NBRC 104425]|nr:hypothetical protein Acsp04_04680 [Actinomadura sp. NBRC 104425]